jgi:hypothetical protein
MGHGFDGGVLCCDLLAIALTAAAMIVFRPRRCQPKLTGLYSPTGPHRCHEIAERLSRPSGAIHCTRSRPLTAKPNQCDLHIASMA